VHKFRRKIHTVGVQFYGRGESFFLGNYNMIVKSIAVGDMFLNVNGDRVTILEIECGLDEDENRWETSIKYERFSNGVSAKITEKARVVVQMLGGNEFYSQVYPSGDVTKSNVIKPRGNSTLQNNFIEVSIKYGLLPSDIGRTVMRDGSKYQIVGAKLSRGVRPLERPIVVEGPGGGLRRFSVDEVKEGLELYKNRRVIRFVK
jgi:hypothetical protein